MKIKVALLVSALALSSFAHAEVVGTKIYLVCAKTLRQTINVRAAVANVHIDDNGENGELLAFADGTKYIIDKTANPYVHALQHPGGLTEQCIPAQK